MWKLVCILLLSCYQRYKCVDSRYPWPGKTTLLSYCILLMSAFCLVFFLSRKMTILPPWNSWKYQEARSGIAYIVEVSSSVSLHFKRNYYPIMYVGLLLKISVKSSRLQTIRMPVFNRQSKNTNAKITIDGPTLTTGNKDTSWQP